MTNRERVLSALKHRTTDIIPYNIVLTKQEHERTAKYFNDNGFLEKIGNHIKSAVYEGFLTEIESGSGYWKDDFGVVWNRNAVDKDIGVIDGLVIPDPDIDLYKFPEVDELRIRNKFEMLVSDDSSDFKFGAIGFSMFERAWSLRGMENFLVDMVQEPEFADELLDRIAEYDMRIIDIALEYNIDGFHFGDDWGQQRNLIMGPEYWRRFIKPRMAKLYNKVKDKGLIVSQHSCGDIQEIFPDLIDIGLDVYQTFQPEIYDIRHIKSEYGNDLSFWGGISTQTLLPFASPAKVKEIVLKTMDVLGRNGGYIAAPTHDVPGDVPPENIEALIEVFTSQGSYLKQAR